MANRAGNNSGSNASNLSAVERSADKLARLQEVLAGGQRLLIVLQDFPDPDAMGSAAALRELANAQGLSCSVACGGVVGRAENRALIRYLDINLLKMADIELQQFDVIGMVDTQPATGNNALPDEIVPHIVIDHHPIGKATRRAPFFDVRSRYGANATILYEYLTAAQIELQVPLATGLLYGIRSDTNDLGREATQPDIDAFLALYPLANRHMLSRIELERLPPEYFRIMAVALVNARTQGKCVHASLGQIENPDMIGEIADLLLRNEQTSWALCYGVYDDRILLSLRTSENGADAGELMHKLVRGRGTGGGHDAMSGGQLPLERGSAREISEIERVVVKRYAELLGMSGEPRRRLVRKS